MGADIIHFFKKLLGKGQGQTPDRMNELVELCKKNSSDAYDRLWSDEELLQCYLEPSRVESYLHVVKYALSKGCGNRIVDIGFGSGDFLKLLCENAPEKQFAVYGLDYAESAVKRANETIPNGNFVTGDVYNLPYSEDFFDTVFCIQTLEHLKKPVKALSEFDRICKPSGMIIITIPNGKLDDYEGHVNFWSESAFREFLSPRELIDFKIYNEDRVFMVSMKPFKG